MEIGTKPRTVIYYKEGSTDPNTHDYFRQDEVAVTINEGESKGRVGRRNRF